MYVNPQSEFRLLKDVPFDRAYMHTILFSSASNQYAYMSGKTFKTYSRFTYIRHGEAGINTVKIPDTADNIYGCNYCMFKNTGFGDKWFYGFVTSVEYRNNDLTYVSFVIDHWQTWLTEMEIGTCYIEREHVADDTVGQHTVEENLPTGDYVCDGGALDYEAGSGVIVQMAYDNPAGMQEGVFSGLTLQGASASGGAGSISDLLTQFADQPEKVAMVTMASGHMVTGQTVQSHTGSFGMQRAFTGFRFAGKSYSPKNNKLYCYPYCLVTVDNYNGNSETYKWEDFNDGGCANMSFVIHESPIPRPSMECYPASYKGIRDAQNYGVSYDNFPMCPYVIDTYRAWSSQATPKMLLSTGASIAVGITSGGIEGSANSLLGSAQTPESMGGNIGSGMISAVNNVGNYMIDRQYHQVHSTSYGGSIAGSGLNFQQERVGFRFISYTIKPEYARIVDDYFTRFGYKVMEYKIPNLKTRTSFNYIKCIESNVGGNIPQEAIDTLEASLNRGITLWHNLQIKNYELENEVR